MSICFDFEKWEKSQIFNGGDQFGYFEFIDKYLYLKFCNSRFVKMGAK